MSRATKIRLLLLLVILLAFGRVITHDFVDWDDGALIFNNPNIVNHSFPGLLHHWNPFNEENTSMYNPLVFTTWWVIALFSDVQSPDLLGAMLNPYLFHAASLAVHWLCACLVFEILRKLKFRDWPAAAGALIFAVHPLQTESVAWATAMKDLLSGFFALLTILQYMIAVESKGKKGTKHYWLMSAFYLAALLSKPSTVVLPLIITVIGRLIYRRSWRELIRWTLPWYVLALAFTIVASKIQHFPSGAVGGYLWERPLVALDAIAFYLGKLILPIHLTFDYGRNPVSVLNDPDLHHPLYWTWSFPVALAVILWRSKQIMLWTAALIFLLGLLPVLGLTPFAYQYFTTVADRYVYLPMLGIAIAIAWWLNRTDQRNQPLYCRNTAIACTVLLVILGSLSFVQADRWRDTETLYNYSLNTTKPIHLLAIGHYHDDLALPYAKLTNQALQIGNYAKANESKDKALAEYNRAMSCYRQAIKLDPDNTHGYEDLYKDEVTLNQFPEAIETIKQWMAVESNPNRNTDLAGREKPGTLEGMLGLLYLKNHQVSQAVEMLKRSLALQPNPYLQKTLDTVESLLAQQATRPTSAP